MILSLPETLSGIARVTFEPERVDYAAPEASGRQGGVQAGFPLWAARFEIDRSDPVSADIWRAFLLRLRGRTRSFYGWDPTRRRPINYRFGFGGLVRAGSATPFTGSALTWSQAINADGDAEITLTGLPAGFVIGIGDYLGFKWDASGASAGSYERRTVARAVLPVVANGAGQAVMIVEPPVDPLVVPPGAIAHFDDPACVMRLVPEQTDLGPIAHAGVLSGATIVAVQDLRP